MKKRSPELKVPGKFDPQIRWLLVYFVVMLVTLWVWQELFRQFAVQTIPYSEFKAYLSRHEVVEASIQQDEIVGRIEPRAAPAAETPERDCSEETAREIDEEVKVLLDEAYASAKQILTAHRDQLQQIATELLKKETLDGREFYRLVGKEIPHAKEPVPPLPEPPQVKA